MEQRRRLRRAHQILLCAHSVVVNDDIDAIDIAEAIAAANEMLDAVIEGLDQVSLRAAAREWKPDGVVPPELSPPED